MPALIALSGVRISWLMLARKAPFARLDASAASGDLKLPVRRLTSSSGDCGSDRVHHATFSGCLRLTAR